MKLTKVKNRKYRKKGVRHIMKHSKTILKCLQLELQREKRVWQKQYFKKKVQKFSKNMQDTKQQI